MRHHSIMLIAMSLMLAGCAPTDAPATDAGVAATSDGIGSSGNVGRIAATPVADAPFAVTVVADFENPWAMAFLPGRGVAMTNAALITDRGGTLWLANAATGTRTDVTGVPTVAAAGQGGLGDVIVHPDFAGNGMIYLSWVEEGPGGRGAAVGRGRLTINGAAARLEDFQTIWRATPFVSGNGHFGHRLAFGPDGMLYISTGERQAFDPAQDVRGNLGKILRLNADGSAPADNPFADMATRLSSVTGPQETAMRQIWSLGHRNPLGIAFDADGRLWSIEMGPAGGDELNLIERGGNYGYPLVSNGSHYDGRDIPDHAAGDGFVAPRLWWNPAMSPGHLMIYSGNAFPAWRSDAFVAALGGQALIRIDLNGTTARQADRWDMDARIRSVTQGPDGALWLLEDGNSGSQGRLLRLDPRR